MDNHHHHIRYPPPPPPHGDQQQPLFPPPPPLNNNQYHNYQQQWQPQPQPQPPPQQYNNPHPPQHQHNQGPYYNQHGPPPPPPQPNQPYSHPQPYYNSNQQQQWGNQQSWGQQQQQQQQPQHQAGGIVHNNEEDWGARAKAWASASASIESQHPQSQFSFAVRQEEQPHTYYDQYQQAADPHYTSRYQESQSLLGHQQVSVSVGNHQQDFVASSSGQSSSYVADALKSASNHGFSQANILTASVYQQEVPSSYSSFPGKEENCDRSEQLNKQSYLPTLHQVREHSVQSTPPFPDRSAPVEQSHFTLGNQSVAIPDPNNQPLEFVQPQPQLNHPFPNLAGPAGFMSTFATVQGNAYPPVPSVPSVMQFDQSFGTISIPGLSVSTFGNGPNFHPTVSGGASSFNIAGTSLHPLGFPGDANGVPSFSDRPRKAPVPNWLREEIIKKTVLTTSSLEIPDENLNKSIYDNGVDKSFNEGEQEDSKDIDSSKSSEHEEDDEDDVDAEKAAAVNKELKRLLTQILSKVTDQLFDEIADRVVNEDDSAIKGNRNFILPNREASLSLPARSAPTASATVLLPSKTVETEANGSSSILHSSLSGILSYASDSEEDNDKDESRSSIISITRKTSGDKQDISNNTPINNRDLHRHSLMENASNDYKENSKMDLEDENISSSHSRYYGTNGVEVTDPRVSKSSTTEKTSDKSDLIHSAASAKNLIVDGSQKRGSHKKLEKDDGNESKKGSSSNAYVGDGDPSKLKTDIKSGPRERMNDRDTKSIEKNMKPDSRKSSDSKDNHREMEKVRKATECEDNRRNREAGRDEKGRSRHKSVKDPSRHKRRRSSSRDRRKKDNSRSRDHSGDEASDNSRKRKPRSRNRSPSPSPSRSKRRQVSRSPHSRHSQRRHSSYSSHEMTRRSRSKSPVRKRSRSKSPVKRRSRSKSPVNRRR